MAIVKNFWLQGSSKRLAGAVLYEAMGQTRVRQLAPEVSNPRTEAQMNQRVKWANLVNLYKANASWMKYAYETKKPNQSEYNKFMSLNVTNSRIFLTKDIAANGGAVVDAYVMTQGSLPSIEWQNTDTAKISNILIDRTTDFTTDVTVGELSRNLVSNNPGIQYGDQLSFIRMTQLVADSTGVPYLQVRKYEMIVDSQSTQSARDYLPLTLFGTYTSQGISYLSFLGEGKTGGYLMILSRTIGGKTYVSTQSVIVFGNEPLINNYSSATALADAIASYGQTTDPFLSSTTANQTSNAPTELSLLGLYESGAIVPSGTLRREMQDFAGGASSLFFNGNLNLSSTISADLLNVNGNYVTGNARINPTRNTEVDITWPTEGLVDNASRALKILLTIDGVEYSYRFDRTDGGLE